jgi:hypothetical protein
MTTFSEYAFVTGVLGILLMVCPGYAQQADQSRLDEVARRGAMVMPFDLEKTQHIFTKTATGGLQQVIAKSPADAEQIKLIRAHLSKIAHEFAKGDFSDPEKIHGKDMPGLEELRSAKPGQILIQYQVLDTGAQIAYSTNEPRLVAAIHKWFDAQLSDHARHAVAGHDHEHMHAQ